MDAIGYLSGFGNNFATEAIKNTLPQGQNSPKQPAHGLYAEQINGSSFTMPHTQNLNAWLYRIRPSVIHSGFKKVDFNFSKHQITLTPPDQMRWSPIPFAKKPINLIESMTLFAKNGDLNTRDGSSVFLYSCNKSMQTEFFYNSDGEMLFVPEMGKLKLHTEMGILEVSPQEIAVIPRGIKFNVELLDENARGYILENYGQPLTLPNLGPIGANGLANKRDFLYPCAKFNNETGNYNLFNKFQNQCFCAKLAHNPLDVVAWHGNYAPFKYNLKNFNTINTVSFDHPDPSIFTVLTSTSAISGMANVDFVIFPERWMVAEHSFKPPYYHRNTMSELMGLIHGKYDAKETGFVPGGISLHNCMTPHGPDVEAFNKGFNMDDSPFKIKDTMAFMFESYMPWQLPESSIKSRHRQQDYQECWQNLPVTFKN